MAKRPIPPHRILLDEDVISELDGVWRVTCDEGSPQLVESGGVVAAWEPGRNIRVSNSIALGPSAYDRLGGSLCEGMTLRLKAVACTARDLEIVAQCSVPLVLGSTDDAPVELVLDGSRLAGDISILVSIVVDDPPVAWDALSPRQCGTRLWSSRWRARIEGGRSRLAIEAIDFDQYFGDDRFSHGLIHVVVADDPQLEVEQGLLVYLNAAAAGFVADVARREPRATALLWDTVLRRVIVAGSDMDFSSAEEYPDGSIGKQWQIWTGRTYGRKTAEELLAMSRGDISGFELRIQSCVGMKEQFSSTRGST